MQARLRAQLGDWSKYSGERRRRSVVVASIVLTITDPLRGSYPLLFNLQAALIRSCGASFSCMELTIISRFQRLQASIKSLLYSPFYSFSVLSKYRVPTMHNPQKFSTEPKGICINLFFFWIVDNFDYLCCTELITPNRSFKWPIWDKTFQTVANLA